MKKKENTHYSGMRKTGRVMIMAFAIVLTACFAAGAMLESNADQVNNYLHTRTTVTSGGGDYDTFLPDEKYLNDDGTANTDAIVAAHREMGIKLAEEGSVLLKNKNSDGKDALPLSAADTKVTLMGFRSTKDYANYGMDIGSPEEASQNVSFRDALIEAGFQVNGVVCDAYDAVSAGSAYAASVGTGINAIPGLGYYVTNLDGKQYTVAEPSIDEIRASAGEAAYDDSIREHNDAAIIVIGRPASEQSDYFPGSTGADASQFTQSKTKNVLSLSDSERNLISYAKENFEKVIIVVNTSNAMELDELEEDDGIDAILWVGCPGNYGFIGVANVLAGKANPSGRLTDTYAASTTSAPAMVNYGLYHYTNYENSSSFTGIKYNDGSLQLASNTYYADAYVMYAEGIYTGYKYYETRYEDAVLGQGNASSSVGVSEYASGSSWNYTDEVTYSFGYGLSYTKFNQAISSVSFSDDKKTAYVTVQVENTGDIDGKAVVQLYAQSPYTGYDKTNSIEKASVQLVAYEKIDVPAHQPDTVTVEVDMQLLASYDETVAKTYIMEAGTYYFSLGANDKGGKEGAHTAVNNILALKGKTTADGMDADGSTNSAYAFEWLAGDSDLFSVSKSGTEITNRLDDIDYNYFNEGTVTYLSRSNWQSTWPVSYSSGITADLDMMTDYLQNRTYIIKTDDDVSGVTLGATYDESEDVVFTDMFGTDFDDPRWDKLLDKLTLEDMVRYTCCGNRSFAAMESVGFVGGGFSYTENGSVGIQKTLSGQSDSNAPWYVDDSDANASYYTNSFGSAPLMASTWDKELMYEMGVLWGNDALFVNIPMVWAPSLNTHRAQYNGRNGEYYSEDGVLSGYTALAVGSGALEKGLITAIKHFAFNSQETARNGISTYMTEQTAREGELRGFQIALEGMYDETGRTSLLGIMTGYNRIGARYVGAHQGLMQGILREEWNYNGYVTSDLVVTSSNYMTYPESMLAGTTNFDASINSSTDNTAWREFGTVSGLADAVNGDAQLLEAIKQNVHYSLYTFSRSNMANWMSDDTRVVWVWNWWRATYYGGAIISIIGIAAGLAMYIYAVEGYKFNKANRRARRETKQSVTGGD